MGTKSEKSSRAGAPRLVAAADRRGHRGPARDRQQLPEGSRPDRAGPWPASRLPGKTGHFAGGAHRLFAGHGRRQGRRRRRTRPRAAAQSSATGERVRAVPRADRRRARPRAQRDGHLVGPGRRPRFPGPSCTRGRCVSGSMSVSPPAPPSGPAPFAMRCPSVSRPVRSSRSVTACASAPASPAPRVRRSATARTSTRTR